MQSQPQRGQVWSIFGGASFPALAGAYTVTWPLAVLRADAKGLSVDLRWRFLKRSYARDSGRRAEEWTIEDPCWTSSWSGVTVEYAEGIMRLANRDGKTCQFFTWANRLRPFIYEMECRNITVRRVRGGYSWRYRIDRPPKD